MNTEIMNNVEEVTEMTMEVAENVCDADNGFVKGLIGGAAMALLVEQGVKLAIKGVKKYKAKKYIEAEVVEVNDTEDDEVEEDSKKVK